MPSKKMFEYTDNKALRELRDEVKDLNITLKGANKSTDKFSWAIMVLAFVQIAIGLFQFIQDSLNGNSNKLGGVILIFMLVSLIIWLIRFGLKEN